MGPTSSCMPGSTEDEGQGSFCGWDAYLVLLIYLWTFACVWGFVLPDLGLCSLERLCLGSKATEPVFSTHCHFQRQCQPG